MIALLVPVYCMLIFGLPLVFTAAPILFSQTPSWRLGWIFAAPAVFSLSFVLVAGLLSLAGRKAIIRGTFPRDLKDPVYGPRRLYSLCWTAVYYFAPLYFALLSVPFLRGMLFRIFGYTGSTDVTIYPDVWIRDLPLLKFSPKAYLANKATIGTNICLMDGRIMVEGIKIGHKALVGHMALVAPGVRLEDQAELGVHVAIGIRSKMQEGAKTQPCVSLHHGVSIGKNAEIGACSFIGLRAQIGDGVKVPGGANIPAGATILTQEEMAKYHSSETHTLNQMRMAAMQEMLSGSPNRPPEGVSKAHSADEVA